MILGTHNSATASKLVWWQRPLTWIIQPFSQCQIRSIDEQLKDGVRWFNLQITYYKGECVFSHGLAIYDMKFWDVFNKLIKQAKKNKPIYVQIYYDANFFLKKNTTKWEEFKKEVEDACKGCHVKIQRFWNENKEDFGPELNHVEGSEKYWGLWWIKDSKEHKWYEKLPLPYLHAKKYNKKYKEECSTKYFMMDFYEIG